MKHQLNPIDLLHQESFMLNILLKSKTSVYRILLLSLWLAPFFLDTLSAQAQKSEECLACHSLVHGATKDMKTPLIDMGQCGRSIHIKLEFDCIDCHSDIEELPHKPKLAPVDCVRCHEDAAEVFDKSIHGQAVKQGIEDAPTCQRCHGSQNLLPSSDPDSPVHQFRIAQLCGECHSDPSIMKEYNMSPSLKEDLYREGVHASEVRAGNKKAPTCINCHGYHEVLPLRDPKSPTNFMHVANTCGQCHKTEMDQYSQSIHGTSAASGHKDAPVCTDCHGEHAIFRVKDERSPVSFLNLSANTCARCHSSIVINEKYNIQTGQVSNFFESYHGLALQRGSKIVANCGSCHGNHLILPSSDERSTVSPQRLVETCGACHPGITANVLAAPIHKEVTIRSKTIIAWVPRIYIPLIVIVIGGMIIHNGIILWALLREKFKRESNEPGYARFTKFEIVCHILLTITFIVLCITGFALLSPKSWWVTLLSYLYFTEAARSTIHRIAGVMMIVTSIAYAFYMIVARRGREELIAFMPHPRDITHVWQNLAFHLGMRKDPPQFERYDYAEKMEFWALVWGVIIMGATGLILWFPIISFEYLPKWAIDMAELIHYYEAVLATLAIIIWHFFFVIFHPEEYPMSATWLTGKMTKKTLKHRHPMEYERIYPEKK
ncbi:MAG: cytochrome b/b6 domain-containing protein [Candidatus Omnitrophota bacterium]